jgi:hypothetical protein
VPSILFDESHGELLRTTNVQNDREMDVWTKLRRELEQLDFSIPPAHADSSKPLSEDLLAKHDILVLAAPTKPSFSLSEIGAIRSFVASGKSLLVAINSEAIWQQTTNSLNVLLQTYGVHADRLLNYPPEEVTDLFPHYLNNAVGRLGIKEPAYFDRLTGAPRIVAELPTTHQTFIAAVEYESGRVAMLGDFVMLGDRYIDAHDNRLFVLNLFNWLALANSINCLDSHIEPKAKWGSTTTFSITLSNPHRFALERLRCTLESNASAQISEPVQAIRYLPSQEQMWLSWFIGPQHLGPQSLRLTIDFPKKSGFPPLTLKTVAQFVCVPDAKIDLVLFNLAGAEITQVETGAPFEAQAIVIWAPQAKRIPLQFNLNAPLAHLAIEPVKSDQSQRWRITIFDSGQYSIQLTLVQTNESVSRLVQARPTPQLRITEIERDVVAPLADEIHRQIKQIRSEFDADVVQQIPFNLVTPEDYIRRLFPTDAAEHLLKALHAAQIEQTANRPLVEQLLRNIAPTYSPLLGCFIPYDPELAKHLAKENSLSEESLAHNFLSLTGYDPIWLEQNVAAFLLHEKYGHGFFFTQTTLGRQLSILYNHGLVRRVDYERLRAPYPKQLHQEYSLAIRALDDSAIIVNEGFAAWVEITVLPRLRGAVGQADYRRRSFLFQRDDQMRQLAKNASEHPYFQNFPPFRDSRYQEGFEYLELIQGYFGPDFGPKCAVQAVIKAADVHLGIAENNDQVQFGLNAKAMADALLAESNDDARADMRLRRIHLVLRKEREKIRNEQKHLQCHRVCLHSECPVNAAIKTNLNW